MAYNLYQVQLARAWAQRIEKENAIAEQFWMNKALEEARARKGDKDETASKASMRTGVSSVPTGFTSKTSYLKGRLSSLEELLTEERARRQHMEEELTKLKAAIGAGARPGSSAAQK